eukprot:SAG31_NODE_25_length_33055_cov_11.407919_18_plen_80_part_00
MIEVVEARVRHQGEVGDGEAPHLQLELKVRHDRAAHAQLDTTVSKAGRSVGRHDSLGSIGIDWDQLGLIGINWDQLGLP